MLMCCLFTWVAYLVMFRIEIKWTKVSCWLCCVAINWLTLFLMLLTSLGMAAPVSQLSASPKKGRRLFLIHVLETKTSSNEGSFLEGEWQPKYKVCRMCGYHPNWSALLLMLKTDELKLKAFVVKSSIVVVFCPSDQWTFSIASLDFPKLHELWWSKNDMLGRLSIVVGIVLTLNTPMLLYWWVWSCILCWKVRWVQAIYRWLCTWVRFSSLIITCDGWQICRVVAVSPHSA